MKRNWLVSVLGLLMTGLISLHAGVYSIGIDGAGTAD